MFYLNNKLLTISGIIQAFAQKKEDFFQEPALALQSLKTTLKLIYFPGITKDMDLFHALECSPFDLYPTLAELLRQIFFDHTLNLGEFAALTPDWVAEDAHFFLQIFAEKYAYPIDSSYILYQLYPRLVEALRLKLFLEYQELADDDVYEIAYKLLILVLDNKEASYSAIFFQIAKTTEVLLQSFRSHGINVIEGFKQKFILPQYSNIQHFDFWIARIRKFGCRGLDNFRCAEDLEKIVQQHHWELNDQTLERVLLYWFYPEADADLEFAKVCQKFKIPNSMFRAAIDYIQAAWPRKQGDEVPDVVIETPGFRWQKLAPGDKRALILGKMSNSCQSLTDYADACVKAALQFPGNGIYVLTKKEKKLEKIIAHSYVWFSYSGNLCLDSFEFFHYRIQDPQIKLILEYFASEVMARFPTIKRVTIGVGGQTPSHLFPLVGIPELIRYGQMFPDAYEQYCIASREPKNYTAAYLADYQALLEQTGIGFRRAMDYLRDHCADLAEFIKQLRALMRTYPDIVNKLDGRNLIYLFAEPGYSPTLADLYPFAAHEIPHLSLGRLMFHASPSMLVTYWRRIPVKKRYHLAIASRLFSPNGDTLLHYFADDLGFLAEYFSGLDTCDGNSLLKLPNHQGECLLHLAARHEEILIFMLSWLEPTAIADIFNIYNFSNQNLFYYVNHHRCMTTLLDLYQGSYFNLFQVYDMNHQYLIMKAVSQPTLLASMLNYLNEAEVFQLFFANQALTKLIMEFPDALLLVLKKIPRDRLPALLTEVHAGTYVLHQCAAHLEMLSWVMLHFTKYRLYRLAQQQNSQRNTAFQLAAKNIATFNLILSQFSVSEQVKIVRLANRVWDSNLFCAAAKDHQSFLRILNIYHPDERKNLLMQRISMRWLFIHLICNDIDLFRIYIHALPLKDRTIFFQYTQDERLNPVVLAQNHPQVILELLTLMPPEQRLLQVNIANPASTQTILQSLLNDAFFLYSLWQLLPKSDQAQLLQGYNGQSLLELCLLSVNVLPAVLEMLPKDAIFSSLLSVLEKRPDILAELSCEATILSTIFARLTPAEIQVMLGLGCRDGSYLMEKIAQQSTVLANIMDKDPRIWRIMYYSGDVYPELASLLQNQEIFDYVFHSEGLAVILQLLQRHEVMRMHYHELKSSLSYLIKCLCSEQLLYLLSLEDCILNQVLIEHDKFNLELFFQILAKIDSKDICALLNIRLTTELEIWRYLMQDSQVFATVLPMMPYEDMLAVLDYKLDYGMNGYFCLIIHRKLFYEFLANFSAAQRIVMMQFAYASIRSPAANQPQILALIYELEGLKLKFEEFILGLTSIKLESQISYMMTLAMLDALRHGVDLATLWKSLPMMRRDIEVVSAPRRKQMFFSPLNRIIADGFQILHDNEQIKAYAGSVS